MNTEYKFDVAHVTERCIEWIREWFAKNGGEKPTAIVGISGGKDSAVVAALCAEAIGRLNVVGVMMPNGEQKDIADAETVINHLKLRRRLYANIGETFKALQGCIYEFWAKIDPDRPKGSEAIYDGWTDVRTGLPPMHITKDVFLEPLKWNDQATINTPARLRMTTLYAIAAAYGGRVANTCNRSEDVVGWATCYGDSAGDFAPLSKLTVTEVIAMGEHLGLPSEIVHKTPSDGLCGKSDEEGLGMKYADIDKFIRNSNEAWPDDVDAKVMDMWEKRGKFKLALINVPSFDPGLYDMVEAADKGETLL